MGDVKAVGIGIIGCGNISAAYLEAAKKFEILDIRGIADIRPEAAAARATEFGLKSVSIEQMLDDPLIEIIVNLTIPRVHLEVGLQILTAGKHLYAEKPLGITFAEGKQLVDAAHAANLRIGSAPDTFLGGAHQTCREIIDNGFLGTPVGGTAYFMCPGHESWHPDPAFYYDIGGGPVLDMAPYYITEMVNLFGSIRSVFATGTRPVKKRVVTSELRIGIEIPVLVDTHVSGLISFANGATLQMTMSFDVAGHTHNPIELYGTDGSLVVPDPNHFDGQIRQLKKGEDWVDVPTHWPYADGNYRSIGVADMAYAVRHNRAHRANGDLALHALEVMEAFSKSSNSGQSIEIATQVERPDHIFSSIEKGKLAS